MTHKCCYVNMICLKYVWIIIIILSLKTLQSKPLCFFHALLNFEIFVYLASITQVLFQSTGNKTCKVHICSCVMFILFHFIGLYRFQSQCISLIALFSNEFLYLYSEGFYRGDCLYIRCI